MIEVAQTNFMKVALVPINATVHTTSFNSDAYVVAHARGYAIQAVFTGTTTGTIKLQGSNDPATPNAAPTNWVDIAGSTVDLATGSPFLWNVVDHQYTFVRIVHTDTGGGDLTLTVRITTKG